MQRTHGPPGVFTAEKPGKSSGEMRNVAKMLRQWFPTADIRIGKGVREQFHRCCSVGAQPRKERAARIMNVS